jgi:hypothetical protein
MAWIEPKWDKDDIVDVNAELKAVKGDLDEDKAKLWLGKFLIYNIQFLTEILLGITLHPRQAVLMKSWFNHNYNLAVWGRGAAKSTLIGLWSVLDCIFTPGTHTLIVSQNFRSSRRILENLEKLANAKEGILLIAFCSLSVNGILSDCIIPLCLSSLGKSPILKVNLLTSFNLSTLIFFFNAVLKGL